MIFKNTNTKFSLILSLALIVPLYYAYDFTLRVMPSVLGPALTSAFQLTKTGLGFHTSLFLWGYAFFQIPAGWLIDRFGSKRNLFASCLICSLATLTYAMSTNLILLHLSRMIMGAAAAFAYVGTLKATSYFLEERHFATYAAYVQMFGCVGAILGGGPFSTLVNTIHWRHATLILSFIGFTIALLILLFLPARANQNINVKPKVKSASTGKPKFLTRQLLCTSAYSCCIWAPVSTFAGLWGIPFLQNFYHISTLASANSVAAMWAGITIGGPLLGMWSSYQKKRLPPMKTSAIIAVICSFLVIFIHFPSLLIVSSLLFLLGICCSSQALTFGVVIDSQHPSTLGTASSIANTATISAGLFLQPFAGHIIDEKNHLAHNSMTLIHNYQLALVTIPIILMLSVMISLFLIKETHCRNERYNLPEAE